MRENSIHFNIGTRNKYNLRIHLSVYIIKQSIVVWQK
jgi:hypothetical protein